MLWDFLFLLVSMKVNRPGSGNKLVGLYNYYMEIVRE